MNFGDIVQFEAQVNEEGGSFVWEVGPFEDMLRFSEGGRLSYRAVEEGTNLIRCSYSAPSGGFCRDFLFVRVQNEFAEDE